MSDFVLKAELRTSSGSNAAKKLRAEKIVPAQLYQKDKENLSLQVVEKDLEKIILEAGQSAIVTLVVDGKEHNVLVKEFQKHPYKNQYVHVDFLGINMNETLKVSVPVVLVNRDDIYVQPSVLLQHLEQVEVETLPKHMPQQVELDVKEMQIGDTFYVKDIEALKDSNITVVTDAEEPVCTLNAPQEVNLDEEVEAVDADSVEVIGEEESSDAE